jgi:asparagine synthase (glutamine-hydrolysing)
MCGICGFVGPAELSVDFRVVVAMAESIRHRGPDEFGRAQIGDSRDDGLRGWLGHRRLKILDLTASAAQPMRSRDRQLVLTYNGEIYNFRELRQELRCAGHRFESTGDTEVVLRAYEEWGDSCLERLDGMFAFALWDGRRGRLLLARDRSGKKPLFYTVCGERLTFGSEIKALLQAPWVRARPDTAAIPEFLTYGYVPHPRTLYEGILQVPPASSLTFDADGVHEPRSYWDPLPGHQFHAMPPDAPRHIAHLLREATRRRLTSDVPLGAFLSGGIDSSLIVALMASVSEEPPRTFTIGFPGAPSFDERRYARLVADRVGTRHMEFAVGVDSSAVMDRLLWHHDQPYADSSAVPTYALSRLARDHVVVVLNGDGGDEVFGGYDRFAAAAVADRIPRLLARMAYRGTTLLPAKGGSYRNPRRRAERFLGALEKDTRARYRSWVSVVDEDVLGEVLQPAVASLVDGRLERSMDLWHDRAAASPALDQILYVNFKTYLPDDLSVKVDRMSMANSLETRSPFLDTSLVEYLARVPAREKVGLWRVKPLLRRSLESSIPAEVWQRRKHGFGVPIDQWFAGELGRRFEDEVLCEGARSAPYLRPDVLRQIWERQRRGQGHSGALLWSVLTFECWLRSLGRAAAISPPGAEVVSA